MSAHPPAVGRRRRGAAAWRAPLRSLAVPLALALGLAAGPLVAAEKVHRVAVLFPGGEAPGAERFIAAMAERGYTAGRNVAFHMRAADGQMDRLPRLARELVGEKPHVIVTSTAPAAHALVAATREIPIVMAVIGDPIALNLTRSIARPTGNVTGFTTGHDTLAAKRLQLLLDLVPTAKKIALIWVRENNQNRVVAERTRQAAAALQVELLSLPISNEREISRALARAESERAAALLVAADPLTINNRRSIIDECFFRNLPAMHSYAIEARDGALMSYGTEVGEDFGRVAEYVDRLLRGAKVAELPFQEPSQIRLTINLRTARSIGLAVPLPLLVRADEVIE